jgi:hypothetical protein
VVAISTHADASPIAADAALEIVMVSPPTVDERRLAMIPPMANL